jgi:hypothetical protein
MLYMDRINTRLLKIMEARGIEKISELSYLLQVPEQTIRVWMLGRVPRETSHIWAKLLELENDPVPYGKEY